MRALLLAVLFAAVPVPAFAQSSNAAAAETLFMDGRTLLEERKYAQACPKLAESYRLDPATGTLMALALCHEGEGKFASAWAEFKDVSARAQQEGRKDRDELARQHAQALEPRLSKLSVDVPPEVASLPGLEVTRDGVALGAASFGVAVPVDGGEHRVEATAPGKEPWSTVQTVKPESDVARVSVPPLADAKAGSPPAQVGSAAAGASPSDESSWPTLRTVALITAGAGVVAMGVGGYLAMDARSSYDEAKKSCTGTECPDGPYNTIQDAQGQGNIATILFAVGGAAVATGAVLWFVAPSSKTETASRGPVVERVGVGPRGFVLKGSF